MFGISKATWLKKDLIELLDKQDDFVSSQFLASKLTYASVETIKKMCRELKAEVEEIYQPDEAEFIIHKHHGIRFIRHTIHTQNYVDYIYSRELAYEVFMQTFLHKSIDTYDFCEAVHISESKLRRKIKEINGYMTVYGLHFSCGSTLSVEGPEHKIRILGTIFLFSSHRTLPLIPNLENVSFYIKRTSKIFDYLQIPYIQESLQTLSLSILLTERRLFNHVDLTEQEQQLFYAASIPARPPFLENWTDDDWRILLLVYDTFDIINLESVIDYAPLYHQFSKETVSLQLWIEQFEAQFRPLTTHEQQFVSATLYKNYIASQLFHIDYWLVATFNSIDFERLETIFPLYMERFNTLWESYSTAMQMRESDHFRAVHLTLCNVLIPIDSFIPTIRIYFFCDFSLLYQQYAKQFLQTHFKGRFLLAFVDTVEEADVNIICSRIQLNSAKPTVFIRSQLPANDLLQIEKLFEGSINKKQR